MAALTFFFFFLISDFVLVWLPCMLARLHCALQEIEQPNPLSPQTGALRCFSPAPDFFSARFFCLFVLLSLVEPSLPKCHHFTTSLIPSHFVVHVQWRCDSMLAHPLSQSDPQASRASTIPAVGRSE